MKQSFKVPVYDYGVTLNEIPDKIALYFNLGNCSCHCKGCHSDYLWDTNPCKEMTVENVLEIVENYKDEVEAVVFLGGNHNGMDFEEFIDAVIAPITDLNIDVGIYLGAWSANDFWLASQWCRWVKVGAFVPVCGGLASPATNQIFCEIQNYKFLEEKHG